MIALLLAVMIQAGSPEVTASVDRTRLTVGEELVLSIRGTSDSDEPMRITLPPLDGFQIIARSERTEVAFGGAGGRTTTLEVRLRAARSGSFQLGPVTALQNGASARTTPITIVVAPGAQAAQAVSARLRALLERAPPPRRPGEPALVLVISSGRVYVGEQVDVVTAAWFPRDLRARLRRPPTLAPPSLSGVWSYPQPAPPGIAASRQVGGTWYDLFVSHQIVFPLVPGELEIARASLQYSVPVAMQFFSQEERYTLQSNAAALTVLPLPDAGRPTGFAGAVGRGLAIERTTGAAGGVAVRAGETLPIEVTISGVGNVALWPAPDLEWPTGLRHYQDRIDDRITAEAGRLGGTKLFRYLALPDSAGPLRLPPIRYSYFDLDREAYRTLRVPAVNLSVAPTSEAQASRPTPPPLLASARPSIARTVLRGPPAIVWGAVGVLPVLAWLVVTWRDERRRRHGRRQADVNPGIDASDRKLLAALRSLVADAETRTGATLIAALRAAGVDPALAQRIARARDEFLARRYGPALAGSRGEREITREMDELTHALGGQSRHRERRSRAVRLTVLLLLVMPARASGAVAQAGPEQLYDEGAFRAAADGFARRTVAEPGVAAHWYGLGASEYRLGSDARAGAAWVRAARLAPRSAAVRRALRLVPAPDASSLRRLRVVPATPDELALAGAVLWLAGWGLVLFGPRRRRGRYAWVIGAGAVLALAAVGTHAYYSRPLAVVVAEGPMRLSPHGRAPEVARLSPGTAVQPRRESGGWVLVQRSGGPTGWLPDNALVDVSE